MTEQLLKIGDYAPDFTIDIDSGKNITLSEMRGKNIVLYFYPRDNTPGCTTEALDFTKYNDDFDLLNTVIIGISKDTIESHCNFREKHNLGIILASDANSTVCEAYDAYGEKNMYGKISVGIKRTTFLINEKGVIRKIWKNVKVKDHASSVLKAVREL